MGGVPAAKRTASGILRDRNPRERILVLRQLAER